ncbi:phosphomevalonate kinase [Polytolypa hystricis UAMH7299]|uniref:Phosphomevalonate kinase n=1 Tax=Polytolypa hystricis (strain UAMH7299) TaxID=1447883 RepID=A0A2B7Z211_POLH7|nr:phosphomevalonate kinase [Polytolypa hystricis UAMH7299]
MSSHVATTTSVSAPGKVLLTGGYLVLDRKYTGTVFALDARIHVVIQQLQRSRGSRVPSKDNAAVSSGVADDGAGARTDAEEAMTGVEQETDPTTTAGEQDDSEDDIIVVKSPQFVGAVWEYAVRREPDGGGVKVVQQGDGPRNPFVETSLNYALTYVTYIAASKCFGSLSITIIADSDYYSETDASSIPGSNRGTRFKNFGVPLQKANKTGLGSSAALVTALVSALVVHRTVQPEELAAVRDKLHNLAQAAHCAAQGKVGSGFDVAAAVYGSCLYRRFSPSVLGSLGDAGSPQFEERLFAVVEDLNSDVPWDTECIDFGTKLPRGMQMVLLDVDCGSETPGMVKKVLEWRANNAQDAEMIWTGLQRNNERLRLELKRLAHSRNLPHSFDEVRELITRSRLWIRSMTKKCGVPIEPAVQTELLDKLAEIEGVVGGVVPGAGGYDAIALLIHDDAAVLESIRTFIADWKSSVPDDFGGKIERVKLLGVKHGSEGVRNEVITQYAAWLG